MNFFFHNKNNKSVCLPVLKGYPDLSRSTSVIANKVGESIYCGLDFVIDTA